MKKLTKMICLLLSVMMIFTGCMSEEDIITIHSDGTVTQKITTEVDKERYIAMAKQSGATSEKEVEEALKESLNKSYGSNYSLDTIERDGREYFVIQTTETLTLDNTGYTGTAAYMTTDTFYQAMDYTEMMETYREMGATDSDIASMKVKAIVEFPEKIVASEGGTISEDNPNAITFETTMNQKVEYFATTNSNVTLESVRKIVNSAMPEPVVTIKTPSIKSIKVTSVKKKKGTVKIAYSKVSNATYEVQYATNKNFKKAKTVKSKKTTATMKKLTAGKKYYFRVRAVEKTEASYIVPAKSSYSKAKSKKIAKSKKK